MLSYANEFFVCEAHNVLFNRWLSWYIFCISSFELTNTDDQFYLIQVFYDKVIEETLDKKLSWESFCVNEKSHFAKKHFIKYLNFSLLFTATYRFIDPGYIYINFYQYAELQTKNFIQNIQYTKENLSVSLQPTSTCIYPIFISSKSYFMKPFSSSFI